MTDRVRVTCPVDEVLDHQTFTVDVALEDRSSELPSAPSTVEFRIDDITDPTAPVKVQDWTSVTAGESVAIALSSDYNAILTAGAPFEIRQITVAADRTLTFESRGDATWKVINSKLGA